MERNQLYVTYGLIALVLLGGIVWWTYSSDDGIMPESATTPTGTEVADASNGTPTTPASDSKTTAARASTAYTVSRVKEGTNNVAVVTYTDKGFSPKIVEIERGDSVRFVNQSNQSMRIASNTFEDIPLYPGFNQVKSVGQGGTYSLSFTEPGVWGYHNLSGNPEIVGVVYVK